MRLECLYVIVLIGCLSSNLSAQREDHMWLFGWEPYDINDPVLIADSTWGSTNIDFNFDPPMIYYDSVRLNDLSATNASICSGDEGELLLYSNGQAIYGADHTTIEDTINHNQHWDNFTNIINGVVVSSGFREIQGAMILPTNNSGSSYHLFYSMFDSDAILNPKLQYSIVDLSSGKGVVTLRDEVLVQDTLAGGTLNAVRHANGRDWWVVKKSLRGDRLYRFLLTADEVVDYGAVELAEPFRTAIGQLYFSPDGSKVAVNTIGRFEADGARVFIADFDRCTGTVSNPSYDLFDGYDVFMGLSFSQNSRFLYATDTRALYQYDLWATDVITSRILVEEYDGFKYNYTTDPDFAQKQYLGWMGLAPDGKIYMSAGVGGSRVMHRINNPNYLGADCDLDQHSVYLPSSYASTMPNFPNFRLGPLDGSGCDTLDLDNNPIAKYRYVQDSLDYRQLTFFDLSYFEPVDYEWTFGDGDSSTEQEPVHIYSQDGVYEVCLTVSNEYNTDQTCRTIMVGTTATEDGLLLPDITLFPNPTADYLTVSLHDYVGGGVQLVLYSVAGAEVYSESLSGRSHVVDLSSLPVGAYFYTLRDRDLVLKTGNLVRI